MSDFTIRIEGEFELTKDQLWPDNDGPDQPTVDDVVKLIEDTTGRVEQLIGEWNLRPSVSVIGPVVRQTGTEAVTW